MAVTAAELLIKIRAIVEGSQSVDDVRAGLSGLEQSAQRASSGLGVLGDAAAAAALTALARQIYDSVAAFEAMGNALEALHGDQAAALADMQFIADASARMGVNVRDAGDAFISLTASTKGTALEGQNTRAIFEAVAGSMAILGKSSAETGLALRAISQIASKGTVSMEELRGQLGEALPGAMQAAARAMGRTTEELIALVSTGTLTAEEFLPKLADALNDTFGTEAPDTLNASMARLQNSVQLAFKDLGETGSLDAFKSAMEGAATAVNFLSVGLSGIQEAFEVAGKTLGASAAALVGAFSGDFGALFNDFSVNLEKIIGESAGDIERFTDRVSGSAEEIGARTPPAILPAKTAVDNLVKAFRQLDASANDSAKKASEALDGLGKNIDLSSLDGIKAVAAALKELAPSAESAAKAADEIKKILGDDASFDAISNAISDSNEQLNARVKLLESSIAEFAKKANAVDLSEFSQALKAAFTAGQIGAESYGKLTDEIAARQATLVAQQIEQSGKLVEEFGKRAAAAEEAAIIEADAAGKSIEARRLELVALDESANRRATLLEQRKIELALAQEELAALLKIIPVEGARTAEQQKRVQALTQQIQRRETGIAQSTTELAQAKAKLAEGQKLNEQDRETNRLRSEAVQQALAKRGAEASLAQTQAEASAASLEAAGLEQAADRARLSALRDKSTALQLQLGLQRQAAKIAAEDLAAAEQSAGPEAKRTKAVKDQIAALNERAAATRQAVAETERDIAVTDASAASAIRAANATTERTAAEKAQAEAAGKGALEIQALANATQDVAKQQALQALATEKATAENDEFLGSTRSIADAIAKYIDGVGKLAFAQAQQAGATDVSAQAFDRLYKSILSGINAAQQAGSFRDLFGNIKEAAEEAQRQAEAQQAAYAQLFAQVESGALSMRQLDDAQRLVGTSAVELNDAAQGVIRGLGLIDQQRLDGLISQINQARQAMESLKAATEDQIFAEEQRRRRLQGDELAAKQAEFARQEAELRAKIAATQDADLRRTLQRQLDLLRDNNELELKQLRDKERERKRIEQEAEAERKARDAERQREQQEDANEPVPTRPAPTPPSQRPEPEQDNEPAPTRQRPEPARPASRVGEIEAEDAAQERAHLRQLARIEQQRKALESLRAAPLNLTIGALTADELLTPETVRKLIEPVLRERVRLRS